MKSLIEKIRNIGIAAHIDAGKTTTTERILFYAGQTKFIGNVDQGSTVTDFLPQERERGITIQSACVPVHWKGHQINVIDTPGHVDFTVEVERSLRVLDGAVILLDGVAGVEAQTETVWNQANAYKIPRVCFVNKLDRAGASMPHCLSTIKSRLFSWGSPLVLQWPLLLPKQPPEMNLYGIVDLLSMNILDFSLNSNGNIIQSFSFDKYPLASPSLKPQLVKVYEEALARRVELIDTLSGTSETLLNQLIDVEEDYSQIYPLDIQTALRPATLSGQVVPVLCGASFRNMGVQPLMDAIVDYLPSPKERPQLIVSGDKELNLSVDHQAFSALAFKVTHDHQKGPLVFVRVYSGTLPARATIYNKTRKVQEKVPKILQVNADDYIEMDQVKAGDIAVLVGLKSTCTGDTLVLQPNAFPQWFKLDPIPIPPAVFMCSIEPCTRSDESTMEKALTALQKEDPSLHIIRDEETGQTLLGGMGELHLEIALDRLQKNFKVNLNGGQVKIAYREGLVSEILASRYTYDHKILDMKRFAEIEMSMEPLEPIQEFLPSATQNHIHVLPQVKQDLTGVIPSSELTQALQAIHQGVEQGLYRGPLRQYPLTNMNVTVHSVKGVPGQTLIPVLKVAAIQAVQQLLRQHQDKVILWEPLMDVSLQVPTHALGSVTKSINSTMRGHVLSMDLEPISQRHMIQANIPLKALIGFSSHLRSLTKGAGNFAMSLKEYSPVSADQLKDISRA